MPVRRIETGRALMEQVLDTFAFYANEALTAQALEAGATGVVVDWEQGGKERRQQLYDTQVNRHGEVELRRARRLTDKPIICRLNGGERWSADEQARAVALGADEVLVPMVTTVAQVEAALAAADGQVDVGMMIETPEAVRLAGRLAELPVKRVYVGLNDLAIGRGEANIFLPLIDGTVDAVRRHFSVDFGVAGLTHTALGDPVPCHLLLSELQRLRCTFTFLRRSFYRDLSRYSAAEILTDVRMAQQNRPDPEAARRDFVEQVLGIGSAALP